MGPIGIVIASFIVGLSVSNIVGTPEGLSFMFMIIIIVTSFYYRNVNLTKNRHAKTG